MTKILFVCHGNICRSPMAEFVMKDLVKKAGLSDEFYIASAATSTEEIGNGVHYGTRKKLAEFGISVDGKYAVQLKKSDYAKYDYIIGMDSYNLRNMKRMLPNDTENKIHLLLDWSDNPRDIADPWYTGDFDVTYNDVLEGCIALLKEVNIPRHSRGLFINGHSPTLLATRESALVRLPLAKGSLLAASKLGFIS